MKAFDSIRAEIRPGSTLYWKQADLVVKVTDIKVIKEAGVISLRLEMDLGTRTDKEGDATFPMFVRVVGPDEATRATDVVSKVAKSEGFIDRALKAVGAR